MRREIGFVAAWAGATVLAVVVAAAAVGSVRSDVTDEPTALGSPSAGGITSQLAEGTATTLPDVTTSTTANEQEFEPECPDDSSSCVEGVTTTTDAGSVTTTTDDDQSESTSTTTTAAATTTYKSVDTEGGSVTFSVTNGEVNAHYTPNPGWHAEVESDGTREVTVKFEKNDDSREIRVKGQMEDGVLKVTVSDSSDD